MNARLPAGFKISFPALAVILLTAALAIVPSSASAVFMSSVDEVIDPGHYQGITIGLSAGDTLNIDLRVQTGPSLGFYFMNQSEFSNFQAVWPDTSSLRYSPALSAVDASVIHKSAPVESDGLYVLAIANSATAPSSVVGTIETPQFPIILITAALAIIVVVLAATVVAVIWVRRSVRARLSQYSPPGKPTPPGQTHQHLQAQRPVIEQDKASCPKCGSRIALGSTSCSSCGEKI